MSASPTSDPLLGPLSRHGDELVGSIELAPLARPARNDGSTECEVSLDLGRTPAVDVTAHVAAASEAIRLALTGLESAKRFGLEHAPEAWRTHYALVDSVPLLDRLFLNFIEVGPTFEVFLWFDFGDLDQLVVRVDRHGIPTGVEVHE